VRDSARRDGFHSRGCHAERRELVNLASNHGEEYKMKVFVAGATGVVGRRAVTALVRAGFEVTGVVRSSPKRAGLVAAGGRPVEVDLFDPEAVRAAVDGHDVVVNLATAIPVGERANSLAAWQKNARIRREGAPNLVDAALAGGASHYVQESIAFLYTDGEDRVLDELSPVEATAVTSGALVAEAEVARFARHGGVGIALRFGQLYGFDSAHTVEAIENASSGRPVELGPESAYRSVLTTDDAGSAVVAALSAPSGVYNVVDDEPMPRADNVDALTRSLRVPALHVRSLDIELPPEFSMMLRSQRVSNQRFRTASGWQPSHPSAWEGWAAVVAEWRERRAAVAG
jgi:2-alkyl-3-oxoalkanoate reductase